MKGVKRCATCAHDTELGFCGSCWRAHNPDDKENYADLWTPADDDSDWTPSQAAKADTNKVTIYDDNGNVFATIQGHSQSAKADAGKPRITLVPRRIIWDIAAVRQYGVEIKYPETGVDGWRTIGKERIRDAMCRHMLRYFEDPDGVDEESGLPHLWHVATNVAFLCEVEDRDEKHTG